MQIRSYFWNLREDKCKRLCKRLPKGVHHAANTPAKLNFLSPDLKLPSITVWILVTDGLYLSSQIPWDQLVGLFNKRNPAKSTGRPALNPRVLIEAVIIKDMLNLDDRETVAQITENMYLQYFLGYSSYIKRPFFDASLFVDIRKRLGDELIAETNDKIHEFSQAKTVKKR